MATPGAVKAGAAYIEYFSDDKKARTSAKNLGKDIQSISRQMQTAFAAIGIGLGVREIISFGQAVVKAGDDIDKGSKRLSVTAEQYQKLGLMARFSGAEASNVEMAFKTVSESIVEASNGSKEYIDKLGLIGLKYADLKELSPYQQFEKVSKSIAAIKNPTERMAAAVEMFGKSGKQLLPLINDFDSVNNQVDDMAQLMSNDAVAAAARFTDQMTALDTTFKALATQTGFLEYLGDISQAFLEIIQHAEKFKKIGGKEPESTYAGGFKGFISNFVEANPITEYTTLIGLLAKYNGYKKTSSGKMFSVDLTNEEKARQKKEKETFQSTGKSPMDLKREEEIKQATIIAETKNKKAIETAEKEAQKAIEEEEKRRKRLNEFLENQLQTLMDEAAEQAFINQGLEKQWYILKEIADAKREAAKAGQEFTEDQRSKIIEAASRAYDIKKKKELAEIDRRLYQSSGTFDAGTASAFKAIQTTQKKDEEIAKNTQKTAQSLDDIKEDMKEIARYQKLYGGGIPVR